MIDIFLKTGGFLLTIFAGYMFKRIGLLKASDAAVLRKIMLNLTLPCVLAGSVQNMNLQAALFVPLIAGFVIAPIAIAFSLLVTRSRDRVTQGMYMLNIASFNVASVAVPFISAFFPAAALSIASIFDIGNAIYGTGGVYAYASCHVDTSRRFHILSVLNSARRSTPLMIYVPLLLLFLVGVRLPDGFYTLLRTFGSSNSFLAFFIIGLMIDFRLDREDLGEIIRALVMRYVFILPVIAVIWLLPIDLLVRQVLILSLLAPFSAVAAAFCANLGCKPQQTSMLNTLSIFTSMIATVAALLLWQI